MAVIYDAYLLSTVSEIMISSLDHREKTCGNYFRSNVGNTQLVPVQFKYCCPPLCCYVTGVTSLHSEGLNYASHTQN